jgi:ketosteroid isomerase-like protein
MDMTQVRKAIEEGNAKFGNAVRKGDGAAIAALYTEDATLLPPDSGVVKGRKEVIEQKGKYVVVWEKAPDQVWKLHVDIWNSGPAVTKGS